MNVPEPLTVWINHVFNHPVSQPPWYYNSPTTDEEWPETRENVATHIAEAFEHSGPLLSRFSDEQLNQGFWYLFYRTDDFMDTLLDTEVAAAIRLRALRSFVPLFEQVMAARCSSHLAHVVDEESENVLDSACYMWFDEVLDRFFPYRLFEAGLDSELVVTLRSVLAIPHDACRESALHGIGHWIRHLPHLADVIDQFLDTTPGLRPELIAYAQSARAGEVL